MTFRYVVRCLPLVAMALVAVGCSSSPLPAPSSAGTSSPTGAQGVQGAGGGVKTATGTVTVRSGGKTICVIVLKNGTGSCKVSTKGVKPGSVKYVGLYSGGGGLNPTESKPVSVQINAPKAG
jgi:Bacterial Ig-like domain (group 3)